MTDRSTWKKALESQKKEDSERGFKVPTIVPVDDPTVPDPSLDRLVSPDYAKHRAELIARRKQRLQAGKDVYVLETSSEAEDNKAEAQAAPEPMWKHEVED